MKETERDAMLNMDPNDNEQKLLLPASSVGNMELGTVVCTTDQRYDQEPQYTHIDQNEFLHRRHKKQQEEDIVTCECKYEEKDLESACGERCLNVLTSTECTPGYCPCSVYCKNQRFQKSEYAKIKLFKTEGRGWGIQANQNIKAGQFIIEYCGEVISCKEAKKRSHAYELEGIRDAFIISLNASESIDATVKGSLARFINHSCLPNCETRKWNVLGEIRVGIFAKQDILVGTELSYDYNFEWYGGAKVRCLCGASSCSGFLGAKSRGFQGDTSSRGSGVGSDAAMDSITQSSTHEADTSTRGSEVDSECVMDFTSEFTTYEIFKSRESLMLWAREAGKRNGFVIVTVRSDLGGKSLKPRVTLGCERGGKFKVHKERYEKGEKQRCGSGSKKCGCPFTLKGEKLTSGDGWMLKVACGVHNHALTESLEGHSYAGRLSEEETSLLIDLSKSLVRPKEILSKLKQRDSLNVTTIRTIYNARQRQRVKEKAGRSQMEQLLFKLNEHNYFQWHRTCPISENVLDLFWAHPVSLELLRVFPTILMLDCTFKTNRFRYPLLEVVGVTSTNMTFSIAFVLLDSEKEDNYVWALNRLRDLLDGCPMPNVIVTDKDLELMRAVVTVFPSARHMLCKWHINKNVMAKCRNLFESKEKWDRFIMKWNVLVTSPTEKDFVQELAVLQSEFSNYTEVLNYVTNTWLNPFKERFVAAWTDMIMHFGNVASNRAESAHSKLKRQLGLSQGNFEGSFEKIHALLELQHTDIKASFENSLTVVQHSSWPSEFKHLRGVVSTFALDKVLSQFKLGTSMNNDDLNCGCVIRCTHGLPCAHELAKYTRDCRPIPLESVDPHWRKLHMSPTSDLSNETIDVDEFPELELLQYFFSKASADNRLMLRKRVRELVPSLTTLVEPGVKSRTRGQLKERIDMSGPINSSACELIQSASVDSHSRSVTGDTMDVLEKSTHKQTGPMKEKVYRTLSAKVRSYIDSFPVGLMPYIERVKDVCDDGNCGFRAVADLVGLGENAYLQVRNDLLTELSSYSAHYGELYGSAERVRELAQALSFFNEGRAPFDRCMTMPDMGHLIASCYKIVLFHLSATQCLTFLPLRSTPVPLSMRRHIAIGLVNDSHYVEVFLKPGHPVPPIESNWIRYRTQAAQGWDIIYADCIAHFQLLARSD
ncbi:protein FAR1-RELATED SEQUENCE 11 isoform X1 [Argentina anserina]|uniref:protein FAR1-RELATED SEQUENCE 11 isoform X1 n=1 Tax=Argentina anserina TaxID=57926 RepID=UPI0021764334|nr:protein FAR1-RELATED SEQUENCE 11 isoform X1 [Potentilla anserina]